MAAIALAWIIFGGSGGSGSSAANLGAAPGIPPPDYAYLDTARVALYLGQLQGGLAKSEQLSQQLNSGRNASLTAGGVSIGGSVGASSSLERVVTPTATARFYQLLDQLGRNGYLHTIDAAAPPKQLVRAFSAVPEGSFVRLQNCTLRLPGYVQLGRLSLGSSGYLSASNAVSSAGQTDPAAQVAIGEALQAAGRIKAFLGPPVSIASAQTEKQLRSGIRALAKTVRRNPRVPVSTCDGKPDLHPRGVDLLFPIRLGGLSSESSLLAGPVTVVGKLVRRVRTNADTYVDEDSLAVFDHGVQAVDVGATGPDTSLGMELASDVTVLPPGAVILPLAIYK